MYCARPPIILLICSICAFIASIWERVAGVSRSYSLIWTGRGTVNGPTPCCAHAVSAGIADSSNPAIFKYRPYIGKSPYFTSEDRGYFALATRYSALQQNGIDMGHRRGSGASGLLSSTEPQSAW